jgi:hypothetical protein
MAKDVLKDVKILVNSVDLSDHAHSIEMPSAAEEVDVSSFGSSGYKEFIPGLRDATVTIGFFNDHAAASVADTIQPLAASGGTFPLKIWPDRSGTIVYTMTARAFTTPLLSGNVGEANTIDVEFRNGGTAGITRGTA